MGEKKTLQNTHLCLDYKSRNRFLQMFFKRIANKTFFSHKCIFHEQIRKKREPEQTQLSKKFCRVASDHLRHRSSSFKKKVELLKVNERFGEDLFS